MKVWVGFPPGFLSFSFFEMYLLWIGFTVFIEFVTVLLLFYVLVF